MDNTTNTQQATDQTAAQPAMTSTPMPAADVTMTPVPAADVNTAVVTETAAPTMGAVSDTTPGPAPVEVPEVKIEESVVPAQATPVATETPATPTV